MVKCAERQRQLPSYDLTHKSVLEICMPDAKSSSKRCFKCGSEKPLSDFYRHSKMADGHLNKCKDCTRADVQGNRANRLDYYREYDRRRADLPHRVKMREEYTQTERGKAATAAGKAALDSRNKDKKRAHLSVKRALFSGAIDKPSSCSCCGASGVRIEGHHPDYTKPLDVIWLCSPCHKAEHKRMRDEQRSKEMAA
jgi:hypothetical protein